MNEERILIVGAGIAGIAMARELARRGRSFDWIERRGTPVQHGSGIALPFNAIAALAALGGRERVLAQSHRVTEIAYLKPGGEVLSRASLLDGALGVQPFVAMRRETLHACLLEGLTERLQLAAELTGVVRDEDGVRVECSDDRFSRHYDLVIAADGLSSRTRRLCLPDEGDGLVDLGFVNWRFLVREPRHACQPSYYFGQTDLFMRYPISPDEVYCYAHVHRRQRAARPKVQSAKAELRSLFAAYAPRVRGAIESADESEIIEGRLRSVRSPQFSCGRVAFIGDAANGCSPLLQQGAASAFEDVLALSAALSRESSLDRALTQYEARRRARVEWVLQRSDDPLVRASGMQSAARRLVRNAMIRMAGPFNVKGWRDLAERDDGIAEAPPPPSSPS